MHEQAFESPAALEERLHGRAGDLGAEIHGQALQLDAIGGEGVDVRVVHEVDPVQIDHHQIRRGRLELVHVYHLVNLLLFLLDLLVSSCGE